MIVLSIETSCDDTCVAVLEKKNEKIRSIAGVVSSQEEVHKKWGGIHPSEAKREHLKNFIPVLRKATDDAGLLIKRSSPFLKKEEAEIPEHAKFAFCKTKEFLSKYQIEKIDAIAVTVGPGLEPCLWTGINFARALSFFLDKPIIPINHIKGHIFSSLLEREKVNFPTVVLIVSGGHTELILMSSLYDFELIGKTRDDAAGECFDKTARILGLPYPGGPAIAKRAEEKTTNKFEIKLPRPMMHSKDYDFSFSGLKTAVLYDAKRRKNKDKDYVTEMAKEIEEAITDILIFKLKKAAKEYTAKTIIISGGVSANNTLRKKAKDMTRQLSDTELIIPPVNLCTDNAEMIGAAAFIEKKRETYATIAADANLTVY